MSSTSPTSSSKAGSATQGSGLLLGSLGAAVRFAVTTRAGGVSRAPYDTLNLSTAVGDDPIAVAENRRRVKDSCGLRSVCFQYAEHGAHIEEIDFPRASSAADPVADGMVTTVPGVGLAALVGDCVPFAVTDVGGGVVAVGHCGWRGLLAGVVEAVVDAVRVRAKGPLLAAIGPAICSACYPVGEDVAARVVAKVPAAAARTPEGRPALDLRAGVDAELGLRGVEVTRVVGGCTYEDPRFFSHRRDGRTGRHALLAWLEA